MIKVESPAKRLILDPLFRNTDPATLNFSIQVSNNAISAAALDIRSSVVLGIEEYAHGSAGDELSIASEFEKFLKVNSMLDSKVENISVAITTQFSTLVPEAMFEQERIADYLQFVHGNYDHLSIEDDKVIHAKARNVYAIPSNLKSVLLSRIPRARVRHSMTTFIDGIALQYKFSKGDRVALNVHKSYFEMVHFKEGEFRYCNSFSYANAEDLIYFTLFAIQQLGLDTLIIEVEIYGEVESNSTIYQLLERYIRNVQFGKRPSTLTYSHVLDMVPSHHYFTLFQQYLCE